ncbi:YHS domain-containing protein [bacterium]|nr:YHS domain-containing protein [bacterium]
MTKQIDPVCGMQIDEKQAAGKSEYEGRAYYFCSTNCKDTFDQNPAKYAGENAESETAAT